MNAFKKSALFWCIIVGLFIAACDPQKEPYLNITEVKTDFGVTAWLVEDHSLPIISMNIAFPGGASMDTADKQGLARITALMLNQGAGPYTHKEFKEQLNNKNISLSFSAGRDHVFVQLKTLTKHKEDARNLLRLALLEPRFDEAAFKRVLEKEKSRIKNALGDPSWVSARILNDKIFEGHAYSQNSGGSLSSLSSLTREDLISTADKILRTQNIHVAVVGDITSKELKEYLKQLFGQLKHQQEAKELEKTDRQNKGSKYIFEMDIPQTYLNVVWDGISRDDPDYYAFLVLNYIYGGGGFGSRLMEKIREQEGLTYGVYSSLTDFDKAQYYSVSMSTKNNAAKQALDLILSETAKLIDAGVTKSEIRAAKDYLIGSLPLTFTSSDKIAASLLNLQIDMLPIDTLDKRNAKIEAITQKDIKRIAARIFTAPPLVVAVGMPQNIDRDNWNIVETLPNAE